MKVYVLYDEGVQGVFAKKCDAVHRMLKETLGNYIIRSTFLKLVKQGEKDRYKFSPEEIATYENMSDGEFAQFITDTVGGSLSKLVNAIHRFGDGSYTWTWGFEIQEHEVE